MEHGRSIRATAMALHSILVRAGAALPESEVAELEEAKHGDESASPMARRSASSANARRALRLTAQVDDDRFAIDDRHGLRDHLAHHVEESGLGRTFFLERDADLRNRYMPFLMPSSQPSGILGIW